jgi:hypothetical protein
MKTIFTAICLLALVASLSFGQATMGQTTLSAAIGQNDLYVTVASATGISAPGHDGATNTILFVGKEAMRVVSVSGTRIGVARGDSGTPRQVHASGERVWLGPANYYVNADRNGACTATSEVVLPQISVPTGKVWNCINSRWVEFAADEVLTLKNVGTAATGVTATEFGDSRNHITKLTFSGLAVGAIAGAADLAIGKLLYTLPAGAVIVKGSYMNVALGDAAALIDADTPDMGLGTTIGAGAFATLNLVAAGAAENIMTGQTVNDVNGTAEVKTIGTVLPIEAADNHTVYLNIADGWAGADAGVTATGTVILEWTYLP